MANYPKKMTDPTEAALSAIQEALNVRENEDHDGAPVAAIVDPLDEPSDGRRRGARAAAIDDDIFHADEVASRRDSSAAALHAANDDQQSIGQILHALQRRPARTSYVVAALFSLAWVVGCLALAWAYLPDLHSALGPEKAPLATMVGLG